MKFIGIELILNRLSKTVSNYSILFFFLENFNDLAQQWYPDSDEEKKERQMKKDIHRTWDKQMGKKMNKKSKENKRKRFNGIELKHILRSNCAMAAAASATIFDFAYSIRIAPRSDDSRNVPCSADIAEPAHAASLNSINATGTLPCCVPFECNLRRLKPGKLNDRFVYARVSKCLCGEWVGGWVHICLFV